MNIAITGGTGFVGRHLAKLLTYEGHHVILIARGLDRRNQAIRQMKNAQFKAIGTSNEEELFEAFKDCDAVAHCAGINKEITVGDYDLIHVQGTQNVVNAAKRAKVKRFY